MDEKKLIATYYTNARELVRQGNPKLARHYVLQILNFALKTYDSATTILTKARTGAFLDKWIAVSRDLYDKGITDYVLECFGLQNIVDKSSTISPRTGQSNQAKIKEKIPDTTAIDGDIDISGLIEEASKTQGWCAEVFSKNKGTVVEISASTGNHGTNGTGFVISNNGYLITNDHVIFDEENGAFYAKVWMSMVGNKKKYKIDVLFSDKKADVALCKFNPEEIQGITCVKRISNYSTLEPGADCLVIGNAFGLGLSPLTGIVRFTKDSSGNLVHSAPSNPGDSGGPVFNRQGECVGINKSKLISINGKTAEGYANATPMDKIDELLNKWTKQNNISL